MNKRRPAHRLFGVSLRARLCCIALLGVFGSSHAAPLPEQFTATYDLTKAGMTIGETQRVLSRENGQYLFESITRPVGVATLFTEGQVVERSHWQFFQGQPRPLQYTFFNSGSKKKRNVRLDFDWENNQVTNTVNNDPWTMPLEHGATDKLLYQLNIMQDLPTTATSLRYPVADGGKLKYYNIDIVGTEKVKTSLGSFNTVRLRHIKGKRQTTMWCAEELHYLPVRIEQRKNDDSPVVATLTSVSGILPGNKHLSSAR